jgi:hypothetical protein
METAAASREGQAKPGPESHIGAWGISSRSLVDGISITYAFALKSLLSMEGESE